MTRVFAFWRKSVAKNREENKGLMRRRTGKAHRTERARLRHWVYLHNKNKSEKPFRFLFVFIERFTICGMTTTKVIDEYVVELERLSEHDGSPKPIRAIATNTADRTKTAETWWSWAATKINLFSVMGSDVMVQWYLQLLEDNRHVELESSLPDAKPGRVIFRPHELIRIGFNPDEF
jgi:hypothetical protein